MASDRFRMRTSPNWTSALPRMRSPESVEFGPIRKRRPDKRASASRERNPSWNAAVRWQGS
jgi:hypothetical protein